MEVMLLADTETWLLWNTISENWMVTLVCTIIMVWIIAATIENIIKTCSHERSRREIAAYIAEGSMKPEEGERLLSAGKRRSVP